MPAIDDTTLNQLREQLAQAEADGEKFCAEIEQLRSILGVALSEHENNEGQFAQDFLPHHWTHEARRALGK